MSIIKEILGGDKSSKEISKLKMLIEARTYYKRKAAWSEKLEERYMREVKKSLLRGEKPNPVWLNEWFLRRQERKAFETIAVQLGILIDRLTFEREASKTEKVDIKKLNKMMKKMNMRRQASLEELKAELVNVDVMQLNILDLAVQLESVTKLAEDRAKRIAKMAEDIVNKELQETLSSPTDVDLDEVLRKIEDNLEKLVENKNGETREKEQ